MKFIVLSLILNWTNVGGVENWPKTETVYKRVSIVQDIIKTHTKTVIDKHEHSIENSIHYIYACEFLDKYGQHRMFEGPCETLVARVNKSI